MARRQVGAVKYTLTDTVPGHLRRAAVVEYDLAETPAPDTVELDVEYYARPDLVPANRLPIAAHVYNPGDTILANLWRVAVRVVKALVPITDGKSLKWNDKTNSGHLATVGC